MNQVAYVEFGSVYDALSDNIINTPAILVDVSTGTVHKYGEAASVDKCHAKAVARLVAAGQPAGDLVCLTLDPDVFTAEERCYVIRRCVEYSASEFPRALCERVMNARGAAAWLRDEMTRVPIKTTKK